MGLEGNGGETEVIKYGEGEGRAQVVVKWKREARLSRSLQSTSAFSRSDGGNRQRASGLHLFSNLDLFDL